MDDPAKHAGIATVTQPRFPAGSESRSPFFIGGRGHNEPPALRLRDCELDDIRGADVHVSNRPARQRLQIFLRQCIHVGFVLLTKDRPCRKTRASECLLIRNLHRR